MKKSPTLFALLPVVVMLIAAACKKTGSTPTSISANVNGKAWLAQYINGIEPPGLNIITLASFFARSGDTSRFEIDIPDTLRINMPDPFFDTDLRYYLDNGITYDGQPSSGSHGVITVTLLDTAACKLAGTFSGVLYNPSNSHDSITVTDGRFNCGYTKY